MDCGVGGVTMGRFVWDYPDVTALVVALRYLIHHGYSVKGDQRSCWLSWRTTRTTTSSKLPVPSI